MQINDENKIRPEIQAVCSNSEANLLVHGKPLQKGTVARLAHSIDFFESNEELNAKESHLIDDVVDECLEVAYRMQWHQYFGFKNPLVQKKYAIICEKYR